MEHIDGVTRLGDSDPLLQVAREVKKIREDWSPVASGSRKVKTDVYTSDDRLHERRRDERWHGEREREQLKREDQNAVQRDDGEDDHQI